MRMRANRPAKTWGFTLIEMMVVVVIMMVMMGTVTLFLANSRQSVRMRKDSSMVLAYLRNLWDYSKASGEPIVLSPDFENGGLTYYDPRSGTTKAADFSSKARVLAILINDRLLTATSEEFSGPVDGGRDEDAPTYEPSGIYLSEGRGLTKVGIVIGVLEQDEPSMITLATLNLITGHGRIVDLEPGDYDDMIWQTQGRGR